MLWFMFCLLLIKPINMNKKEENLQEQEAPVKNTDKAFVRVNTDGSPVIPKTEKEKGEEESKKIEEQRSR